ncbi:hypothetical protein C8R31_102190 [Nitrosospira sp. Nsp2]|uniref:hypothetical protein n=1 Tax=Nitrosospira sp. Nsp2 TaxID=136548 RepID=UPI000D322295|nr:hypothetical protein [Nitrosospira sp. Nsp2]PTR16176.1 hypothetical protein C8R31_102190 [Nitrosospira sp. Nsp2]
MNAVDKKRAPERVSPKKKNGEVAEQVDLSNPVNQTTKEAEAEEQTLLPHERDQTTRSAGTSQPNENEMSRAVIGQAAEDTEHGLKDTDRRGIPSDIVKSDVPGSEHGSDVPEQARKKKK